MKWTTRVTIFGFLAAAIVGIWAGGAWAQETATAAVAAVHLYCGVGSDYNVSACASC